MTNFSKFSDLGRYLTLGARPASAWFLGLIVAALLIILTLIYGRPVTHSAVFVNDSFVFFDGIHRLANGQIPHVDFSTPVGALSYWLPYLGFSITGGYSGSVEVASILLAGIVVPFAAVLLWQRAATAMALLVLTTVACVLIVPLVPGWPPQEPSHAMHYNRWGWGIILTLFLLGLPPTENARSGLGRGLIAAFLLASLFFIKITYFAVASVYLLLLLTYVDARRRDAVVAVVGAGLILVASLAFTGAMVFQYLGNMAETLIAGNAVRDSYFLVAMTNRHSLILFILAVYAGVLKANLTRQDLLVIGFIGASGLAIIDQNFQFTFIVSLPAAFALLAAPRIQSSSATRLADSVITVACAAMLLPFAADWARVSVGHMSGYSNKDVTTLDVPGFENFYVYDRQYRIPSDGSNLTGPISAQAYLQGDIPITQLSQRDYITALEDGVGLLEAAEATNSTIYTLDWTNYFPAIVDAPRELNGYSWFHKGRSFGKETLPSADVLFDGIEFVMAPLQSHTPVVDDHLDSFGDFFVSHLTEVAQSEYWILFRLEQDRK